MKTPKLEFVESQIAKGQVILSETESGATLTVWEDGSIYAALVTRLGKVSWYRFGSAHAAEAWGRQALGQIAAAEAEKVRRKEVRKDHRTSLRAGDILVSTWGYDQTNVDFYVITKIAGKSTAEIQKIGASKVYSDSLSGYATPNPEVSYEKPFRVRVSPSETVKIKFCRARKWDGRPEFFSEYA